MEVLRSAGFNSVLSHSMEEQSMRHSLRGLTFFASALLLATSPTTHAQAKVEVKELLRSQTSWDGTRYETYPTGKPELTLLKISIPPRTSLDWHSHPMPNIGYVLSGELFLETQDRDLKHTLRQGDSVAEMVGLKHRGRTGELPVELIVFYAGAEGLPLSE